MRKELLLTFARPALGVMAVALMLSGHFAAGVWTLFFLFTTHI
jgi:hypothetical protein